jgi:hypothetical protein
MNTSSIQNIVLAAALAILANFSQPVGALARSKPCCCLGDACKCCCASQQTPHPSDMLFVQATSAADDCSCSSGPNPYGRDATTYIIAAELKEKRSIQHNTPLSYSLGTSFCSTLAPANKPPPRMVKYLYLLHRSLLI